MFLIKAIERRAAVIGGPTLHLQTNLVIQKPPVMQNSKCYEPDAEIKQVLVQLAIRNILASGFQ